MRIRMTSDGVIKVGADSPVEEYAIMQWLKEYAQSGNLRLDVETNIVVESLDGVKEIPDISTMNDTEKKDLLKQIIGTMSSQSCSNCKHTDTNGLNLPCSDCDEIIILNGFEYKDE